MYLAFLLHLVFPGYFLPKVSNPCSSIARERGLSVCHLHFCLLLLFKTIVFLYHFLQVKQGSIPEGEDSTVDLFIPTSLYQSLFIFKILFAFFIKSVAVMRRSTVLSLPPSFRVPWLFSSTDV